MDQIWLYLLAPLLGAILGWVVHTVVVKGDINLADNVAAVRDELTGND